MSFPKLFLYEKRSVWFLVVDFVYYCGSDYFQRKIIYYVFGAVKK